MFIPLAGTKEEELDEMLQRTFGMIPRIMGRNILAAETRLEPRACLEFRADGPQSHQSRRLLQLAPGHRLAMQLHNKTPADFGTSGVLIFLL
jgi:hypothetical protein